VFRAQDALTPLVIAFYLQQAERFLPEEGRLDIEEGMTDKMKEVLTWGGPRKLPD
jgi:hypothetical protein